MKLLSETDTKKMNNEEEALSLFDRVDAATTWQRNYTMELETCAIEDCELFLQQIKKDLNIDKEVSDESIKENMQSINLGLKIAFDNGYRSFPLGETAFSSLIQRAGFGGASAITLLTDRTSQKKMAPLDRSNILNTGLKLFSNKALVMIRDEKVRAVLSGDEADYSILKFSELMRTFKTGLKAQFKEVSFMGATIDHYLSSCTYLIDDKAVNTQIKDVFDRAFVNTDGMKTSVKLISSDVGISGANIYPVLASATKQIMLGMPITLTHKHGHNIGDFSQNVGQIAAMFREASEKLDKMQTIRVKNPSGCLLRLAKQAGLNKKISVEAASGFDNLFGNDTTQFDVFCEIEDIFDTMVTSCDLAETRKIALQENIARICFGNMADYDLPFQWE